MFAIYSYMFTSGLTSAQELSTFIGYGLTEAQYKQIVGDNKVATTQPTAPEEQCQIVVKKLKSIFLLSHSQHIILGLALVGVGLILIYNDFYFF